MSLLKVLLPLVLATLTIAAAPGHLEPMPEFLTSPKFPDYPIFVASAKVLRNGEVDPSLFEESRAAHIRDLLALPTENGCIQQFLAESDHAPENPFLTFEQQLHMKDNTLIVEVTGSSTGFSWERPGSLLRIETIEVIKGNSTKPKSYLFFPAGILEMGKYRLCRKTFGFSEAPRIGEHILILYDDNELSSPPLLIEGRATQIVDLPPTGPVSISAYFRTSDDKRTLYSMDRESFLHFVRSEMKK